MATLDDQLGKWLDWYDPENQPQVVDGKIVGPSKGPTIKLDTPEVKKAKTPLTYEQMKEILETGGVIPPDSTVPRGLSMEQLQGLPGGMAAYTSLISQTDAIKNTAGFGKGPGGVSNEDIAEGGAEEEPITKIIHNCPDGYIFDETTQSCIPREKTERDPIVDNTEVENSYRSFVEMVTSDPLYDGSWSSFENAANNSWLGKSWGIFFDTSKIKEGGYLLGKDYFGNIAGKGPGGVNYDGTQPSSTDILSQLSLKTPPSKRFGYYGGSGDRNEGIWGTPPNITELDRMEKEVLDKLTNKGDAYASSEKTNVSSMLTKGSEPPRGVLSTSMSMQQAGSQQTNEQRIADKKAQIAAEKENKEKLLEKYGGSQSDRSTGKFSGSPKSTSNWNRKPYGFNQGGFVINTDPEGKIIIKDPAGNELTSKQDQPLSMQEGGQVPIEGMPMPEQDIPVEGMEAMPAPSGQEAGFVEDPMAAPAPATPIDALQGEGQQDDVQGELPEGTFVINAMAVQLAGIDELDKMVENAYKTLSEGMRKQGVDENLVGQLVGSSRNRAGVRKQEMVDVAVSNGEYIIPPEIVPIIGEDKLRKINERGLRRLEELKPKEKQQSFMPQNLQEGGFTIARNPDGTLKTEKIIDSTGREVSRLISKEELAKQKIKEKKIIKPEVKPEVKAEVQPEVKTEVQPKLDIITEKSSPSTTDQELFDLNLIEKKTTEKPEIIKKPLELDIIETQQIPKGKEDTTTSSMLTEPLKPTLTDENLKDKIFTEDPRNRRRSWKPPVSSEYLMEKNPELYPELITSREKPPPKLLKTSIQAPDYPITSSQEKMIIDSIYNNRYPDSAERLLHFIKNSPYHSSRELAQQYYTSLNSNLDNTSEIVKSDNATAFSNSLNKAKEEDNISASDNISATQDSGFRKSKEDRIKEVLGIPPEKDLHPNWEQILVIGKENEIKDALGYDLGQELPSNFKEILGIGEENRAKFVLGIPSDKELPANWKEILGIPYKGLNQELFQKMNTEELESLIQPDTLKQFSIEEREALLNEFMRRNTLSSRFREFNVKPKKAGFISTAHAEETNNRYEGDFPEKIDPTNEIMLNELFRRVLAKENSSYDFTSDSPKGAKGYSQLMRKTVIDPGIGIINLLPENERKHLQVGLKALTDPKANLLFGYHYLKALLIRYDGDIAKALSSYNYGLGATDKTVKKHKNNWINNLPDETEDYIRTIKGYLTTSDVKPPLSKPKKVGGFV